MLLTRARSPGLEGYPAAHALAGCLPMARVLAACLPAARFAAACVSVACLAALPPAAVAALPMGQDGPFVQVTFLDVGQADAVVVRAPEGQTALIDAGRSAPLRALADLGVNRVDLLVATHPHADHIGGMAAVLDVLPVRFYMDNGQPHTTATYLSLLRTLRESSVTYLAAEPRRLSLGSVEIEVLPLPPVGGTDHNDRSVGIVLRFGAFAAFLSGDSEVGELAHFLARNAVPDVTLLKAPHHGAENGFTRAFLEAARAEVVVISVGVNGYGHPRAEALAAYGATSERVYRTDRHGHVTVLGYQDGRYEVVLGDALVAAGRDLASERDAAGQDGRGSGGATPDREATPAGVPRVPVAPVPRAGAPAAAAAAAAALSLTVVADAPGNDHQNTNGEYVVLTSRAARELDVGGWRLCDAARHCFRFPAGARLPAGGRVAVHTGRGRSDGSRFYMGSGRAVWNNDGDTATLYDAAGAVVARHVYD